MDRFVKSHHNLEPRTRTHLKSHQNKSGFRAFTSNPSNYTYIPLKNNSYINIFPLKTNTFSLSFQLNNIIITFFSNFHSQPLSKYIKKL
ncbi:hypothetical protein Hanom_Chr04g00357071 [Helianthus anomalus]